MEFTDAVHHVGNNTPKLDSIESSRQVVLESHKPPSPKIIPMNNSSHENIGTRPDEPDFLDQQKSNNLSIQLAWKNVCIWPTNQKPTISQEPERVVVENKVEAFQTQETLNNPPVLTGGKVILRGVSGCVNPGQFLTIIGSTGAGKTTLLQYLSGKMFSDSLEAHGDILMNGVPRDKLDYTRFTAFVQQDDILMETLTIRESLMFAANVKSPGTYEDRVKSVNSLLRELELTSCSEYYFSDERVSKGEKKRASMGVELITNPALIFLDEPTTGMDSYTAIKIVELLKKLAEKGRTVVATIHQPSSDIFTNFDQLMILALGQIIYFVFSSLYEYNK